jgi:hypothetical protein
MSLPSYTFTQKPSPTEPAQQSNFANEPRDGSKQPMMGYLGNGIQTTDATPTTAVKSPVSVVVGTVQPLYTPQNATAVTITATAFTLFVSEVSGTTSLTNYDIIPVGASKTYDIANCNVLYLLGGTGTCVASFYYDII